MKYYVNMTYIFKMATIYFFPIPVSPVCMLNHVGFIFNTDAFALGLNTQKEPHQYDHYSLIMDILQFVTNGTSEFILVQFYVNFSLFTLKFVLHLPCMVS